MEVCSILLKNSTKNPKKYKSKKYFNPIHSKKLGRNPGVKNPCRSIIVALLRLVLIYLCRSLCSYYDLSYVFWYYLFPLSLYYNLSTVWWSLQFGSDPSTSHSVSDPVFAELTFYDVSSGLSTFPNVDVLRFGHFVVLDS